MTVPRYPYCMITFKYLMPGTPNDGSSRDLVRITLSRASYFNLQV